MADLRSFSGLMLLICLIVRSAPLSVTPAVGLDPSWKAGINLAHRYHLQFGSSLEFTLGPWGVLDYPLAVSRANVILGVAFMLFALTVAWLPLRAVLSTFLSRDGAAIGATATLIVAAPSGGGSAILLFGVALALMNYVGRPDGASLPWLPAFGAMCAALTLQIKFSEGTFLAIIVALGCLFAPRAKIRRSIEAIATFLVTSVLAWLLARQSLSDFSGWFKASLKISSAYSDAMAYDDWPNRLSYLLILGTILTAVVFMIRMLRTEGWRLGNVGVIAIALVALYLAFREGTDRHDAGHVYEFFFWTTPTVAWFVAFGRSRLFRIAVLAGVIALAYAGASVNPILVQQQWTPAVEVALNAGYQTQLLANARAVAQAQYNLPANMVGALANHPVAVDGSEATLPWAYGFRWSPPPYFQSYFAYTESFDRTNADWLRDSASDQMILHPTSTAIDGRNTLWDPPQYVLAEMCDTRPVLSTATWLVLEKSTNRCGTPTALSSTRVKAGTSIEVPSVGPSQLLTMSFDADQPNIAVRAGRALNKPFTLLQVNTGDASYRLPRQLASGPLIVSVPDAVDWPSEFGGDVSYREVSFNDSGIVHFEVTNVSQ